MAPLSRRTDPIVAPVGGGNTGLAVSQLQRFRRPKPSPDHVEGGYAAGVANTSNQAGCGVQFLAIVVVGVVWGTISYVTGPRDPEPTPTRVAAPDPPSCNYNPRGREAEYADAIRSGRLSCGPTWAWRFTIEDELCPEDDVGLLLVAEAGARTIMVGDQSGGEHRVRVGEATTFICWDGSSVVRGNGGAVEAGP